MRILIFELLLYRFVLLLNFLLLEVVFVNNLMPVLKCLAMSY